MYLGECSARLVSLILYDFDTHWQDNKQRDSEQLRAQPGQLNIQITVCMVFTNPNTYTLHIFKYTFMLITINI